MKAIKISSVWICIMACAMCTAGSMFYILQRYIAVPYFVTAGTKVIFFGILPMAYFKWIEHRPLKEMLYLKSRKKQLIEAGLLGLGIMFIILMTYLVLQMYIDLDLIAEELMKASSINPATFPFIALYIIFGNSFLEEYFFRGFIFLNLCQKGNKKLAYIFSALLFAIYHVTIFKSWFSPVIIILALIGLFIGGLIFNAINIRQKSIINSWIIHIFADVAIILIGIKMFYL